MPVLVVLGSLWILFCKNPRGLATGLATPPILAFVYANIFPNHFPRTGFSISSTVAATSLPCLCLWIVLHKLSGAKIVEREQFSDAKAFKNALLGIVSATAIILVTAYTPHHCVTAKCQLGKILFGPSPFADFWFASFFGGFTTLTSSFAIYFVFERRRALRR